MRFRRLTTVLTQRLHLRAAVFLVLVAAAGSAHAQTSGYTFTKIAIPGALYTEVTGINNAGQMVGTYTDAAGIPHAFTHDGTNHTVINYPDAGYNYAFGVSHAGHVVGSHSYTLGVGPYHAFSYVDGAHAEWDFPDRETDGRAINTQGDIVGIYNNGFGTQDFGFVRSGETFTTIDYPGSTATYTFGINDAGVVTGTYRDALGLIHGFRYSGGAYAAINFPGALETYIGGINNLASMVGWTIQSGKTTGFVLNGASFRTVVAAFAGVTTTKPRAINDGGEVVGTYTAPDCPIGCGFVARPNPALPAACNQAVSMSYAAGVLTMRFNVATSTPTTWTTWFVVQNQTIRLWSLAAPVLSPPFQVDVPFALPPLGNVLLLSTLSTAASGTVCADFAFANTGTP